MYNEILVEATKNGKIALENAIPIPCGFQSIDLSDNPLSEMTIEPEGEFGGAYLAGLPGKSPFINWAKKNNPDMIKKSPWQGRGYEMSLYQFSGYSVGHLARSEAFARAFCKVLNDYGINCYVKTYLS